MKNRTNRDSRSFISTNSSQKSSAVFGQNFSKTGSFLGFKTKILDENFRKFCSDPDYKYKEDGDLCNRNLWYKSKNLSTPNLDGPNYHRCGPDFENAVCSVNSVSTKVGHVSVRGDPTEKSESLSTNF